MGEMSTNDTTTACYRVIPCSISKVTHSFTIIILIYCYLYIFHQWNNNHGESSTYFNWHWPKRKYGKSWNCKCRIIWCWFERLQKVNYMFRTLSHIYALWYAYMVITLSDFTKNNSDLPLPFVGANYLIVILNNIYELLYI